MKRKIAYCLPSLYIPGGMERVLTIKANYFADHLGYEVFLILTDGKDKEPYFTLSQKVKVINLDVNFDELWSLPLHKKMLVYSKKQKVYKAKLTKYLCSIRPDITVSMLRREINFINSIPDGSCKIGEIHVNRDNFRDLDNEKAAGFLKKAIASLWMKQLLFNLKKLDSFVALTEEDKEKWAELKNITVIGNPLPFYPEQQSDCSSKKIIAVGRYSYQKGFDMLIKAWQIVEAKHPDWSLSIFGGGNRDEFILLKEKNHLHNIHLEAETLQIIDKYCESSLFVLSSRYEGFGMVIAEAMACGVPAISFACPCGPSDIIQDGKDGLLVENGNITELAEKICFLIENEKIRKQMGEKAKINVARYKIEHIAKQWENLFNKILSDKN